MDFCWQRARCKEVRELGWSLFSPAILELSLDGSKTPWRPPADEEALHLLASLDRNPAPLQRHLAGCHDRRLGARFESLWAYFFDHHSFYRILARNRQVFSGKQTLGALDFLIEDQLGGHIIHLELAVKFYLYLPAAQGPELARWLGPNPDDNLAIKYRHLMDHQLPLSDKAETRAALRQAGLPPPDLQAGIVKGYLFSPLDAPMRPGPPLRPDHLQGFWIRQDQTSGLPKSFPGWRWTRIGKEAWLDPAPAAGTDERGWRNSSNKEQNRKGATKAPPELYRTIGEKANEGRSGERKHGFVVPGTWPVKS